MLYLASKSTTRQHILRQSGVTFQTIETTFVEDQNREQLALLQPQQQAHSLASGKALAAQPPSQTAIIIGCDQTLSLNGQVLHKAETLRQAQKTLEQLRGQTHHLATACVLVQDQQILWSHISHASMTMRNFSNTFLDNYLEKMQTELLHSVGCYHYEGPGSQLFDTIEGDYYSILGLPLLPLLKALREHGELDT